MEDGLGWELRLLTTGDEVWEVPEESAQEEGRLWRRTWAGTHAAGYVGDGLSQGREAQEPAFL